MKKLSSLFLIFIWLPQGLLCKFVSAKEKKRPAEQNAISSKLEPTEEDLQFIRRSEQAEKFTFKTLPGELKGSLKESFWGWGSLGFALGAGLSAGLYPLDDDLQNSFERGALFGDTGNDIIGWTFSPYTIGGVSVITWIAAHKTGHPKLELTTRALSEALFLSLGIDVVAKLSFHRHRPDGGRFGFPSGHATAAFTTAGVLTTFYGWKAGIPSYAMASLVSVSRIDDDKHFLSDVVMGAVLGSVIGIGTAKFHKKQNPKFFLYPQVNREQAMLGITYLF